MLQAFKHWGQVKLDNKEDREDGKVMNSPGGMELSSPPVSPLSESRLIPTHP